jgi:hypothetical protein
MSKVLDLVFRLYINPNVKDFKLRFRVVHKILRFWFFWKVVGLTCNKIMHVFKLKWNGALED